MDGILNKFSVFDFFNLIATGAVFSIGLELLEISVYDYIRNYVVDKNEKTIDVIFSVAIIIGICYILGCCLQDIASFIEKKYCRVQEKAISTFLNVSEIIDNEVKRALYRKKSKGII